MDIVILITGRIQVNSHNSDIRTRSSSVLLPTLAPDHKIVRKLVNHGPR